MNREKSLRIIKKAAVTVTLFAMIFMLCATLTSLALAIVSNIKTIAGLVPDTTANWGNWYTVIWSLGLIVLAVILAITGVKTLAAQAKEKKA